MSNLRGRLIRLAYANPDLRFHILPLVLGKKSKSVCVSPTVMLEFPETRQATNFSCGASCVQAILHYYGISIREDKLIKGMGVDKTGVSPPPIANFLRKFGLQADIITGMSLPQLFDFTAQHIPVIVAFQAWNDLEPGVEFYKNSYEDGHYAVVVGFDENNIFFDDPSILAHHGFLSKQDFLDRWHDKDDGTTYQQLGIPVYGKPPRFNAKEMLPIL